MAKTSRSKKGGTCSGRKRPNPKKKKNLRFAELTSKLVKAGSKRFIAKVELKSPSCWNHGRTDRPVKEWKKEFRCNGMEKAKTILDALEWSIRPNLYLRQKSNEKKEHEAVARRRVCTRIERSTSKLMMDVNVIRKEEEFDVAIFLEHVLNNPHVEIIYLHGATPLEADRMFEKLMQVLLKPNVWSINLGELKFSASKLKRLQNAVAQSSVTHMFYECDGTQLKTDLMSAIRENRKKHTMWKYSGDDTHNKAVEAVHKNWWNPCNHPCNKEHGFRSGAAVRSAPRKISSLIYLK